MITKEDFIAFKSGNREAFKIVFDSYYKGLFFFTKKYLTDDAEVEDLLQEVFTMLWEKKDTLQDALSVKAFLYVSARNKALNEIRHKKVVDEHQKELAGSLKEASYFKNHLIEEETYRILITAINELPEQSRQVCKMVMNGVRNVEIAEELSISTSTVKYHKQQAFALLRQKMGDHVHIIPWLLALFDAY